LLVVGLGNPGSTYEQTRHNIGFMVIDELLRRHTHTELTNRLFRGKLYKTSNFYLLKPDTFMNLSGESVASIVSFFKIEHVVVVHDDLDLPFGTIKFKVGGGHGGHNGLKSIDLKIGKEYERVRIGISRPDRSSEVSSYVLSPFTPSQTTHLNSIITHASDAIEAMSSEEISTIASRFTKKESL